MRYLVTDGFWLAYCCFCHLYCSRLVMRGVRIADMSLLYVLLALGLNIVVGYAGLLASHI